MTMSNEEAMMILEARARWSTSDTDTDFWSGIAAAIGASLPALAALAKGEAVVVPKVATQAIIDAIEDVYWDDVKSDEDEWSRAWTAALATSPFKPDGSA